MVQAWYMNDDDEDPRKEHHLDPPIFVTMEELNNLSGVEYYKVDVDNFEGAHEFFKLREDRGYDYSDIIDCCISRLPNFTEKLKQFYTEHLHADEEIRLFIKGSGYFDVRDVNDKWIRIKAAKGDLLILPAGLYHRFTLDTTDYAKVMRLFAGYPVWAAVNRPAENHPSRIAYLNFMAKKNLELHGQNNVA